MTDIWSLIEVKMARLGPSLSNDMRGVPRLDDRPMISGIVHVLRSGGGWVGTFPGHGPRKTLYNRFVGWVAKGVWERVSHALAEAGGLLAERLLDSSMIKAHRCAAGGKSEADAGGRRHLRRNTTKLHARSNEQEPSARLRRPAAMRPRRRLADVPRAAWRADDR